MWGEGMNVEFIGKAEVSNSSNNGFKRGVLTVGIVCFLFAMVIEVILENKSAWVFVVPLMYLVGLRNQVSKKRIILDVPMSVTINKDNAEIVFNNTIRNKTGVFSEKYIFKFADVEKCIYLKKYRELQILTDCQYYKISDSSSETGKTRIRKIRFKLSKDIEHELLGELKKQLDVEYVV